MVTEEGTTVCIQSVFLPILYVLATAVLFLWQDWEKHPLSRKTDLPLGEELFTWLVVYGNGRRY